MNVATHDHRPATASTVAGAAGGPSPGGGRRRRSDAGWWPLLFVGPFFLGVAVFYLFPIVQTAYFSLTDWGPFGGTTFVGADNWRSLLDDGEFRAPCSTPSSTSSSCCSACPSPSASPRC